MSIERATLSDFTTPQRTADDRREERRDIILQEGGVYGRDADSADPEAEPEKECLHCGQDLDAHTARVLGDNNGCVRACNECWTSSGGTDYQTTAHAVHQFRTGDGVRKRTRGEE